MSPHGLEQLDLRYGPVATGKQMREDVEDLRLDAQALAATPELVEPSVQLVLSERVDEAIRNLCRHAALPERQSK